MRFLYSRLHRRYGARRTAQERRGQIDEHLRSVEHAKAFRQAGKPTQRERDRAKRPRVCIIGAGFAGLAAGYDLRDRCIVSIIEARPRVGGRVLTLIENGRTIEAGGELIGYNHPRWLKLARELGLSLAMIGTDDNFEALELEAPLYLDGESIKGKRAENLYLAMTDVFTTLAHKAREMVRDPHKPWAAHHAQELDNTPLSAWIERLDCSARTKRAIEDQFRNDGGVDPKHQSLLGVLSTIRGGASKDRVDDYFTQTETLRCAEGNQMLAARMTEEITRNGGSVELDSPAAAIDIQAKDVKVTLADNRTVEADYVVLAIPPSLYPGQPGSTLTISPALPSTVDISMGTAVKYLSPVSERFWIRNGRTPTATSNTLGVMWEGTGNQIDATAPAYLNLFAGGAPAVRALRAWRDSGRNTTAIRAHYDKRIDRIYATYSEKRLEASRFMAWPDDRWTRGGYACPAPGDVMRSAEFLSKPFRSRLVFAGEHTCPAFYGFMEGALQSGGRAAAAVVAEMRKARR
jgi:monoamine oxidase